jgi:hypothetical protein
MCAINTRNSVRAIVAGVVLALGFSTGAFAQAANTQVVPPKQVGAWTVIGWSQGYCSAERPVHGAAPSGGQLQFVLAKVRIGYRIAVAAQEWELTPQAKFPVELSAQPVFHADTTAIAGGPKLVFIELGADGQFVKKLGGVPVIEIKAAQATLKLPTEGFNDALAELETCYDAVKLPVANPFAAPKTAAAK